MKKKLLLKSFQVLLIFFSFFIGSGCSNPVSSHGNSVNTNTREGNKAQNRARTKFYAKAKAGNWYLVGSTIFQKVEKGFGKNVVPKPGIDVSKPLRISGGHHFKTLNISTDKNYVLAMSKIFGSPPQINQHLTVFDNKFQVLYEDMSITFVGNKGSNSLSGLRWSPDQNYISYSQNKNIWIINMQSKQRVSVAVDHQRDLTFAPPDWSPDSKLLVYENEKEEVVILNIETGEKKIITKGRFPQWSPDGQKLVYRKDGGHTYIYTLATQKERDVFYLRLHHPYYLWSPDSQYIFLSKKIYNSFKSNYYVYSLKDNMLIDLRHKFEKLEDHLIQSLPKWIETRLVKVETM